MSRVGFGLVLSAVVACMASGMEEHSPVVLSTDFPAGNVIVDSVTENEVRVRPDTRTSRGECAPRHWAFRVRNANGRKLVFRFPHDPIFGFLSIRGPAVSHDECVSWKWMTDGVPANPSESFEYTFGPDEDNVIFAWQPLYTESTLRRFVDRVNREKKMLRVETLCTTEKGRKAELLRFGKDENPGKVGVLLCARHHANEIWASFVLQGLVGEALSESPDGRWLQENVSFFVVPFVDKDGVEDGDPGKDRRPHDHNRDYVAGRYSTVRAIREKAVEWAKDKKIILGFDLHACSLEVRGKRLNNEKSWAHNMLFQIIRTTPHDSPRPSLFSEILRTVHRNEKEFIQYLPQHDGYNSGPIKDSDAGKSACWMRRTLHPTYCVTLESPFARPDGRPNTPADADTLGRHLAQTISRFAKECLTAPPIETDAMKPFPVLKPVPERMNDENRAFQSAPSLTVSPKGRLWVAWHTGATSGEDVNNGMVVATSGDGGDTWTPPLFAIDPPGPLRVLDPGLWTDPDGKVWLFYAQLYGMWDGRAGVWAMQPVDPEDANTAWTPARRLCHGFMKNKPIVTRDGTWLLPSEFMNCKPWSITKPFPPEFAFEMPEYQAANVFASKDKGRTVTFLGRAQIPPKDRDCTENMVVERKDGSLWMLVRTKYGIGETVSTDGGKTWTEVKPSAIQNPNSRFYIGRLKSGAMLLVKNGPTDKRIGRSRITAFVSDDDGATWLGGLVLDERDHVSYPDAAEGPDGFIHVVHDRERTKAREILHHRFTEADVRAGHLVTPGSRLKAIVNKAGPKAK